MAQIETYGLVRDKNLSDIRNPQSALTYLLTQLVGKQYTSDDLEFIKNLSTYTELDERLVKIADIVINNINTNAPTRPLITFKNRADKYKLITGEPNFFGGRGLVARYYRWDDIYPFEESLVIPFISSVFDNKVPVQTEIFWERGNIDYGPNISTGINSSTGIVTYTGLFKTTITGEHIFRVNSVSTGSIIIELTDMSGNNYIITDNRYDPNDSGDSVEIRTKILEKFTFYRIKILWFKSPSLIDPVNILDIRLKLPYTDIFIGLHYGYLYPEGYNERNIGAVGDFYANKLPTGGTGFFDSRDDGTENYSLGSGLSSDYRALLTRGRVTINYTPPKNYIDAVTTKTNINLSASSIIIAGIQTTSDISVGCLVLSQSKTMSAFTYVKEVINGSTVSLNKELPQSVSNDTLYFIDQKGLKGYILNYTPNVALSAFESLGEFYGDEKNLAAGDVVISANTNTNFTRISSVLASSIVLNKTITNTNHTDFVLFYYKSGLHNLSLDGYCVGVGSLPVLNGVSKTNTVNNTSTISINSLVDYEGKAVNLASLQTTNTAISVYRIDYSGGISNNTYVTSVNAPAETITISQPTIGVIKLGSSILFSLSTPLKPATNTPKYTCFAPGDTSAPFFASINGIETPPLSSIDIGLKTIEFKNLNLLDSTDSAVSVINPITATFNNKLRVTDSSGRVLDLLLKSN
jgi:hypothetical protein